MKHPLSPAINLHVPGRISESDARRQSETAAEILKRLEHLPGLILADEVGMGKTFVALAVAISVALNDRGHRPIVVMVPPSLKEKWPQDFATFRERCLAPETAAIVRAASATNAVEFLKLLDDPKERRNSIIFLTHGALSAGLTDGWVKLALIQRALYKRKNVDPLRRALYRFAGKLLFLVWAEKKDPDIFQKLLNHSPEVWLKILTRSGVPLDDDPVPRHLIRKLRSFDTSAVYESLFYLPQKKTENYDANIRLARETIDFELKSFWDHCLRSLDIKLPLLVMDEAHHLKNQSTRLASLFHSPEAKDDEEALKKGALGNVFERMLFLTATPFQLGHNELCNIIRRFEGIAWNGVDAPTMGRDGLYQRLEDLTAKLDAAQESAVTLDLEWGKLRAEDLVLDKTICDVETWWQKLPEALKRSPQADRVWRRFEQTKARMKHAEACLQPWVVRHLKPRALQNSLPRRVKHAGRSITNDGLAEEGLPVEGRALLPFLLAARATVLRPDARPVFAEGLASSYEAFLHTRQEAGKLTDGDDDEVQIVNKSNGDKWYLSELESALSGQDRSMLSHPKISATVSRVQDLWLSGEKVLVFCHFIQTGRVLRRMISSAIRAAISSKAAEQLGCSETKALQELERISNRFFDDGSPLQRASDRQVRKILEQHPGLLANAADLVELARRNIRTPSFLVCYFDLSKPLNESAVEEAFTREDHSGLSLTALLKNFFHIHRDTLRR